MELFWIIYLVDVLDISHGTGFLGAVMSLVLAGGQCLKRSGDPDNSYDKGQISLGETLSGKMAIFITVMLIGLGILLPEKDTSYKMLAAYGVTEAYTAAMDSDKVQAVAGKSLKVLEKAMDDYLTKEDK